MQIESSNLQSIPGLAYRDPSGDLVFTSERAALADLAPLPSPYLLGYLERNRGALVPYAVGFLLRENTIPDEAATVEPSRWPPVPVTRAPMVSPVANTLHNFGPAT